MRIVVSGGGTVGHVSPVLATVDALQALDSTLQVQYIGQKGGVETELALGAGLPFKGIYGGKIRRNPSVNLIGNLLNLPTTLRNVRDVALIAVGIAQAAILLARFKPAVVFNKVGPAGLPVGVAAAILRIPMVLHEPDVTPGWANRFLSRWAVRVATGFPVEQQVGLPPSKLTFTGTPVQPQMLQGDADAVRTQRHLNGRKPLVLVVGGSQGAQLINSAVLALLPEALATYRIYHVAGTYDFERVHEAATALGVTSVDGTKGYRLEQFLQASDLADAYAAADIIVARAGANTIAELALLQKAVILIPNRQAAAHQVTNAEALNAAGAAVVIGEGSDELQQALVALLKDTSLRQRLQRRIGAFGHPDAAQKLAELLLSVGGGA